MTTCVNIVYVLILYRMADNNYIENDRGRKVIINEMGRHLYNFTYDMLIELMAKWSAVQHVSKSVHETSCEVAHTPLLTLFYYLQTLRRKALLDDRATKEITDVISRIEDCLGESEQSVREEPTGTPLPIVPNHGASPGHTSSPATSIEPLTSDVASTWSDDRNTFTADQHNTVVGDQHNTVVGDQQTNAGISVNDIMALVSQRLREMEEKHEVQVKALKHTITQQKEMIFHLQKRQESFETYVKDKTTELDEMVKNIEQRVNGTGGTAPVPLAPSTTSSGGGQGPSGTFIVPLAPSTTHTSGGPVPLGPSLSLSVPSISGRGRGPSPPGLHHTRQ